MYEINKYIHYNNITKSEKKVVPDEYGGYLAFVIKYFKRFVKRGL